MFKQMAEIREREIQEFVEFTGLTSEICAFMYDMHPSLESAKESWSKVSGKVGKERERKDEIRGLNNLLTQVQHHIDDKRADNNRIEDLRSGEIGVMLHDMSGIMKRILKLID